MVADSEPIVLPDADNEPDEAEPRYKRYKYPAMAKLLEVQRQMETDALNKKVKAKDRSQAARVWAELEKLRMVKLGKPIQISTPQVALRVGKPRKFGLLRSIDAKQVIDVQEEKAAEKATSAATSVSPEIVPTGDNSQPT